MLHVPRFAIYNCTSLLSNRTSSPGLKAGMPMYGHPSHLNASPKLQFPQEPTLPLTVKSTSARSSESSFSAASCLSAESRLAASSAASLSARPQVQSLHARRRLPTRGAHSGARSRSASVTGGKLRLVIHTDCNGPLKIFLRQQCILIDQLVVILLLWRPKVI